MVFARRGGKYVPLTLGTVALLAAVWTLFGFDGWWRYLVGSATRVWLGLA